jgi:hypothetical protein
MTSIGIEKLKAYTLRIDPAVQRAEEVVHVNRLSREWKDEFVGVLIGSRRADGHVYILDGFQRLLAVRDRLALPDYEFTVQVYEGLTLQGEAEIFLAHNRGRKAVSPYARFRVSLTANDPVAIAINTAVTNLGLTVGTRSSANTIGCIGTMERIVGNMGRNIDEQQQVLEWVLDTYRAVFGLAGDYWRNEILEGLAQFHKKYAGNPNFSDSSLRTVLSRVTIAQVMAAAKNKALGANRVSSQVCSVIQELYDKHKSRRRLVAVS